MRYLLAIPNYSRQLSDLRMLNRCVKSLLQHEAMSEIDIWIFDDGSPYFDKDLIAHKRIVRREENKGYSATVNDAIKFAKDYRYHAVVTINTDVEITRSFLTRADRVFNSDKTIAVIGGLLLYPNGRIQSAGFDVTDYGAPIEYNKNEFFCHSTHDANKPKFVMGVTGALQIFRLDALDKIGVYDERYQLSYEDVEFCFRTWSKGYKCFYDPHIQAIHAESATRGYHVGKKEFASFNQWIKTASKSKLNKVISLVEDANQLSQQAIASRNLLRKLVPGVSE